MKDIIANQVYKTINSSLPLGAKNGNLYLETEDHWARKTEMEMVRAVFSLFPEKERPYLSVPETKEGLRRASNNPDSQLLFANEFSEAYINCKSGVFDVDWKALIDRGCMAFDYVYDFSYVKDAKIEEAPVFLEFLKSVFLEDLEAKTKLLLQILGYCLSDYTKAKSGFFFIGESNSGKSTMLELLRRVFPEETVSAIPLHRFENRFNIARLEGKRLNICTELGEKSFAALDLYKQLTSNEVVTAEHKCQTPFEFRIKCKSINAGNLLPDLKNPDGMDAVINRMVILLFPVSIPKEKQDLALLDKLWEERNVIFSLALDELADLKFNNFIFVEPKDSESLKAQLRLQGHIFEEFLVERCVLGQEEKCHIATLYDAFQMYCADNLLDAKMTKTQFTQRLVRIKGVSRKKFRLNSVNRWGVEGLDLKNE